MNEQLTRKYIVSVAAAIALLAFSYASVQFVGSYDKSIAPSNLRSFSVSGEGKATAVPDIAEFDFTVISEGGTDLSTLRDDNTKKVNDISAFIKTMNVEDKDIQTTNFSIEPRYEQCYAYMQGGTCPPPKIVGYTVQQSTHIKIRDFKKIGDMLSGVAERGANSVSQLSFGVDDETTYQKEARAEAIGKAQAKAEELASASGFKVGRILGISEGYTPVYRDYAMKTMEASAYGMGGDAVSSPSINAGSEEIQANVTITYEIQ
jgi:hypothetical protein